jgi:hypothetical protein
MNLETQLKEPERSRFYLSSMDSKERHSRKGTQWTWAPAYHIFHLHHNLMDFNVVNPLLPSSCLKPFNASYFLAA